MNDDAANDEMRRGWPGPLRGYMHWKCRGPRTFGGECDHPNRDPQDGHDVSAVQSGAVLEANSLELFCSQREPFDLGALDGRRLWSAPRRRNEQVHHVTSLSVFEPHGDQAQVQLPLAGRALEQE